MKPEWGNETVEGDLFFSVPKTKDEIIHALSTINVYDTMEYRFDRMYPSEIKVIQFRISDSEFTKRMLIHGYWERHDGTCWLRYIENDDGTTTLCVRTPYGFADNKLAEFIMQKLGAQLLNGN